ncbi:TetR/AcrR family transcriptional regulator [Actinotignum sp. GS-2025f]|uniref:TetR/AcrR family transcriptional regulator n=1 Tax=Actinotignum sp. GS-2025f TaxID=3427279 RepID=UPI003F44CA25
MPKISAPTVREHRELMTARLVDAAEKILKDEPGKTLSAGAVAAAAGIARNSIYRYVGSVDDLRLLVLERNVPKWRAQVMGQVDMNAEPRERLAQLVVACIRQSGQRESHKWLMGLMRSARGKVSDKATAHTKMGVDKAHGFFTDALKRCWKDTGIAHPDIWASFSRALIFDAFRQVETGASLEDVCRIARHTILAMSAGHTDDELEKEPHA